MARDNLTGAYLTKARATANEPVILLEIATGLMSPNDILRYTTAERDYTFDGDVFTSLAYKHETLAISIDSSSDIEIEIADNDHVIKALGISWANKQITLYRVYRDLDAVAQKDILFVRKTTPFPDKINIVAKPLAAHMEKKRPVKRVLRQNFPGVTGDR